MAKTSRRIVNYRYMHIFDKDQNRCSKTLESLVRESLENDDLPFPVKRIPLHRKLGEATQQLLYTLKGKKPFNFNGCMCGILAYYSPEKHIPLVDVLDDGIYLEEIRPRDSKGQERNLEEEQIFFAIKDNHVAMISPGIYGNLYK